MISIVLIGFPFWFYGLGLSEGEKEILMCTIVCHGRFFVHTVWDNRVSEYVVEAD